MTEPKIPKNRLLGRDAPPRTAVLQESRAHVLSTLGALASGIAHDLNNILFAASLNIELTLQDIDPAQEALRHSAEEALRAAERAKELVQQVLAFARSDAARPEVVAVVPIVNGAVKFLRAALPATIEVRPVLKAPKATVLVSPALLLEVLMNLSVLAVRGIRHSGGNLEISLAETVLQASDPGKPSNIKPGSCLRFRIAAAAPQGAAPCASDESDGLDSEWVVAAAASMGGAIREIDLEGFCSAFEFFLPLARAEETEEIEDSSPVPTGTERILLVDDEASVANVSRRALQGLGYSVCTELSPVAALETFRSRPEEFDLVITDRTMPLMTGEQLAEKVKEVRPEVPVILMTGDGSPPAAESIRTSAVQGIIYKPLSRRLVAQTIRRVLGRS